MNIKFYDRFTEEKFLIRFFICADCEKITQEANKWHNVDDKTICPDCWEKYDWCHRCDKIYLRKEVFFTASCPECEKK